MSIAAFAIILTIMGVAALGLGLTLAVRAAEIHARFLPRMSAGVVGHLRAYGVVMAVMGAAFAAVGLGNIGSSL